MAPAERALSKATVEAPVKAAALEVKRVAQLLRRFPVKQVSLLKPD